MNLEIVRPPPSRSYGLRTWQLLGSVACALAVAEPSQADDAAHGRTLTAALSRAHLARSDRASRTGASAAAQGALSPAAVPPSERQASEPGRPGQFSFAARVSARAEAARAFPAFGPLSIGGAVYYPYRFEGHVHTSHSRDAKHRTVDILSAAERLGLDALVITDHGASSARFDFADYHGLLVPFVGREIGGEFGHAVIWNVAEDDHHAPSQTSLAKRCEFAHRHGGLLVFAHPGWWIDGNDQDPMRWMTPEALRRGGSAGDVDAIELWNGVYRTPLPKLIAAWVGLLEAGVYVPIVGNSDFHRFDSHQLGNAHNLALCERPEPSSCLWSAVRDGRLMVTDGPAAVLSVNERLPGSVVEPGTAPLRVTVEALAPAGGTLQVYLGERVVHTLELEPGVRAHANWQVPSPAVDSYVRIDIQRPGRNRNQPPVSLLSNPVLIDVGAKRSAWR
jgi:hypothetical protein